VILNSDSPPAALETQRTRRRKIATDENQMDTDQILKLKLVCVSSEAGGEIILRQKLGLFHFHYDHGEIVFGG
jgi:hypothetical protein